MRFFLFVHILEGSSVSQIEKRANFGDCLPLKVLCIMMNNRLNEYCEQTSLINIGQIGFKKKSRTSDHLLTLKSLINKYVHDNKKGVRLFC